MKFLRRRDSHLLFALSVRPERRFGSALEQAFSSFPLVITRNFGMASCCEVQLSQYRFWPFLDTPTYRLLFLTTAPLVSYTP